MKTLVASFLYSALSNLFRNQPDLSVFTSETYEHEPNLSFHFANQLWPYLFWLQCDFDVTKHNQGDRRPDLVFHRRGIHALNFLVTEVKRRQNPAGVEDDIKKIRNYWFADPLRYRFGASVLINEQTGQFAVRLLENTHSDTQLDFTQESGEFGRPVITVTSQQRKLLENLVVETLEAEKARRETSELKLKLSQMVGELYGLKLE